MWSKPYNWKELNSGELAEQILEAQYQRDLLSTKINSTYSKISQLENELRKITEYQDSLEFENRELNRELNELQEFYRNLKTTSVGKS